MKRNQLRWLINPLFLLVTATCGNDPLQGGSCQSGADTDGDGLTDDIECRIGSDPNNPDSNGDGLSDGEAYNLGLDPTKLDSDSDGVPDVVEVRYPKICVAQDRNSQRRPPQTCTASTECQAGEDCTGLDPLKQDSDGDGVLDKDEDPNQDGVINFGGGETDPRLWDTDGDGKNDAESGAGICRPDGLGMVVQKGLGPIQLGHDPVYVMAKDAAGVTMNRNAGIVDDAATGVAGIVVVEPTRGANEREDSAAFEGDLTTKLGAGMVGVLVGKPFTTHESLPAIHSTYLYTAAAATSSSAIRDMLVATLTGGTAPGGATAGAANTTFYIDVTTVRRTSGLDDLIVAVSPQTMYNDTTKNTAIRVDDLTNATDVADGTRTLDHDCIGIIASRLPTADFLWTVDVSKSMDDNQALVGNAATTFAQHMNAAGVDYRVGIFAAEGDPANVIDLTKSYTTGTAAIDNAGSFPTNGWKNGFAMLQATTPMVDHWMCRFVTATSSGAHGYCPVDANKTVDPYWPFGINDGADAREEPAAAAVRLNDILKKNMGNSAITNPDYKWRTNATKAFFLATDEFSNANDFGRYFKAANNPDTNMRFIPGGTYNAAALANIVKYFKDNQLLTYGFVPLDSATNPRTCASTNVNDLTRCIVEGNGGAYLNIVGATQAQVTAAMDRIANDIIGASSPIILTHSPITHTLKVTVRGNNVPRSRTDGFDYNQGSKSIVFYGNTYRPQLGDTVYVSYRIWAGATG